MCVCTYFITVIDNSSSFNQDFKMSIRTCRVDWTPTILQYNVIIIKGYGPVEVSVETLHFSTKDGIRKWNRHLYVCKYNICVQ